jgi:peptidoglycan/LPS O-acetylase OafA/YrhL
MRRVIRLTPVLYVTIAVAAVLGLADMRETWLWHVTYLSNWHYAIYGEREWVFWSLAVEERFYLLWPIVLIATPRRHLAAVAIGAIACELLFRAVWAHLGLDLGAGNHLMPGNLSLLAVGALLAIASFGARANDLRWYAGPGGRILDLAAWASLVAAVLLWLLFPTGELLYYLKHLLMAVFFAWIVLHGAAGIPGPVGRILSMPAILYLGRISYGLYVIHAFVPEAMRLPQVQALTGELPRAAVSLIAPLLSIGLASLSWHFLERPIGRLKVLFRHPDETITADDAQTASVKAPGRAVEVS